MFLATFSAPLSVLLVNLDNARALRVRETPNITQPSSGQAVLHAEQSAVFGRQSSGARKPARKPA